jgi:peptide-methionine (R)-S-oxide reductase
MDEIDAQAYAQHKLPEAKVTRTDDEWREMLGDSYSVLRQEDTEYAFSGKYDKHKENGSYECKGCGAELFVSKDKFDSGTGTNVFDRY